MSVASVGTNADGRSNSGEINRDGSRYSIVIDGAAVGATGSLPGAIERLVHELERRLPSGAVSWDATVACSSGGINLVFGNRGGGGGGGGLPPCVARVLDKRRILSVREALQAIAQILKTCCH
jgi:hypothetical protein